MHRSNHWGVAGTKKGIWGDAMEHFTTEQWIDFVHQTVSKAEKVQMTQHLEHGCQHCTEIVSVWQKVHQSAAAEANYQPPQEIVRLAKAAFAAAGLAGQRNSADSPIKVLFDSFLRPAFEGARSAAAGTRQMLYRADPYQIDVQVEAKPGANRIVVTGQLLDVSHPEIIARDTRIEISNLRGHQVHTTVNEFGEFSGELVNSGDLQLTFAKPGGAPIIISLREALGRLPGGKS